MVIHPDLILAGQVSPAALTSAGHRFQRGRNTLDAQSIDWGHAPALPDDPLHWDDLIRNSIRIGIRAARNTLKPALCVWSLMATIAAIYYLVPASRSAFAMLEAIQHATGPLFATLGMGMSVGIIVETVKVLATGKRRWTMENTTNALFNFAVFGLMGLTHYYRYDFQESFFGTGTSWNVLLPKVMFDQFVWTVLIANPYQTIAYMWKNHGFRFREVTSRMRPFKAFWGTRMLPVLVTNWAFWIPMASIVYCFPSDLQIPLSILAVTIWVLVLSVLTASRAQDDTD